MDTDQRPFTAILIPLEQMTIEVPDDLVSGTGPFTEWNDEI
jgi:hypothetical protein